MWLFSMLLQAAPAVGTDPVAAHGESYFSLMVKGGVILIPIFLLAGLAIFLIADKWHFLRKLDKSDNRALAYLLRLIYEGETDKAAKFAGERNNPAFNVIAAGLKDDNGSMQDVEESMQVESRMQIARLEKGLNYLAITASVAPMLGFLGTIFGVIRIFYDISLSGQLDISTISNGLYEKMICSGTGLLVGIIAYSGYSLLNGRIDKVVLQMDVTVNEGLKAIRSVSRSGVFNGYSS